MSDAHPLRRFLGDAGDYRWDAVDLLRYKDEGAAPFRDVTRQTLFRHADMRGELRYFEVAPGGHTTLERHRHTHAVLVLRGTGRALIGEEIVALAAFDLVSVAPLTWHQFRAPAGAPLGFLCMVDAERDKPELPDAAALAALRAQAQVAAFLDGCETNGWVPARG
jgi:quercetin dioxygenase-like cupin family protein